MTIYSLDNLSATVENLTRTGTFVPTSDTIGTAIPPASIGLYQLINRLISELVAIKNQAKAEEKKIIALISGDAFNDVITADDSTLTFASREAKTAANNARDSMVITTDSGAKKNKPAVLLGGSTSGNLSEDAVFELLQKVTHIIFQIRNNVTSSDGLTVSDFNEPTANNGVAYDATTS